MIDPYQPGSAWVEIVRRPDSDFQKAFVHSVVLEASVLNEPLSGWLTIRAFFTATRAMYDEIAFSRETAGDQTTILEWQGKAFGEPVAGVTILKVDSEGLIERIGLYHSPFQMVTQCSRYLAREMGGNT